MSEPDFFYRVGDPLGLKASGKDWPSDRGSKPEKRLLGTLFTHFCSLSSRYVMNGLRGHICVPVHRT